MTGAKPAGDDPAAPDSSAGLAPHRARGCWPRLIADDFGLGRDHDKVILDLLAKGRLAGVSVMVDGAITPDHLARLRELRALGRQVGLHLNLSHRLPGSGSVAPMGALLRGAGSNPTFAAEPSRQADRFVSLFGSPPDFYDGHQHCHCLPGLRAAVGSLPRTGHTWMRLPLPHGSGLWRNIRSGGLKTVVVAALARAAAPVFHAGGWPVNADFTGFLKLSDPDSVARWLPRLAAAATAPGTVMMVHPGSAEDPSQCPGHNPFSRAVEARWLASAQPPARPSDVTS